MLQKKEILRYIGVVIGSFLTALGLVAFLIPHKIAAGGVSGLATVVHYVLGFPVGITMLVFNIPLFLVSMKELGIRVGIKSLVGTIALSFFVDLLTPFFLHSWTHNPLLAALYGGVLSGLGMGIVFRSKGTTGGTDLAAALVHKYLKFSLGMSLLAIDGLVIVLAGFVFDIESALYALITVYVTSRVIDVVQEGISYAKAAYIISDHYQEIAKVIMTSLSRGVTSLNGKGVFTATEREILLCVVSQQELSELKELVYNIDSNAFVIVSDVHEVLGEGFKEPTGWR